MGVNQILCIRGATTVCENSEKEITLKSVELIEEICSRNALYEENFEVVSCTISSTKDITAFYPARAIRESAVIDAPLFSAQEPSIENSLPLCIRLMLEVANYGNERLVAKHVYLHGAVNLRKDLKI